VNPPLVLLHGFAASSSSTWESSGWTAILEEAGHQPFGIDLLGHGTAPRPHEASAYAHVEDLVAEALPEGPVDALGFSAGARVLLSLAAADPHRFRRLIIAGVGANLFIDMDRSSIIDAIRHEPDPADATGQHFHRLARAPGNAPMALAAYMERKEPRLNAGVRAEVVAPTLVVLGERDFAGPADPLMEALPNARLEILPGTDHFATPKDLRLIDLTLDFLGDN
jgi:pimeloyl-ACP methyl ester carboxylesterase